MGYLEQALGDSDRHSRELKAHKDGRDKRLNISGCDSQRGPGRVAKSARPGAAEELNPSLGEGETHAGRRVVRGEALGLPQKRPQLELALWAKRVRR